MAADMSVVEQVLIGGDLAKLTQSERVTYFNRVCESLSLNPLTKPFEFLSLNGKTILYARRDCADQLRKRDRVSIEVKARELVEGVYIVTASASTPDGRKDESVGAVPIEGLKGEARANAMMKAETKAKRRVTLSICGLGMLDETEVDSINGPPSSNLPKAITQGGCVERVDPNSGEVYDDPPDRRLVDEYLALFAECTNGAELQDVGAKVAADPKLTTSGKVHLRGRYSELAKKLPKTKTVAREPGDESEHTPGATTKEIERTGVIPY